MRTLHELPRFKDRWSYLYVERGTLDQTSAGLVFRNIAGDSAVPIDQLSLVMLGPGSSVTHAAVKALAANNCLLAWVGEEGIRLYAHSTGGTFDSRRLMAQARLACDKKQRLAVVYRMYQKRFSDAVLEDKDLQQVRGMEGLRVRQTYEKIAAQHGIKWQGRNYNQDDWFEATPTNRACRPPMPACMASAMRPSSRPGTAPPSASFTPARCSVLSTTWPTSTKRR